MSVHADGLDEIDDDCLQFSVSDLGVQRDGAIDGLEHPAGVQGVHRRAAAVRIVEPLNPLISFGIARNAVLAFDPLITFGLVTCKPILARLQSLRSHFRGHVGSIRMTHPAAMLRRLSQSKGSRVRRCGFVALHPGDQRQSWWARNGINEQKVGLK